MKRTLALALLLAGCGSPVDPAASQAEIESLVKKYHDAFDRADVAAVTDMLDPEVCISKPPGFIEGKDLVAGALREGMERIAGGGLVGKRITYIGSIKVVVEGSTAVATYAASIREDKGQGGAIFTRVFRRGADKKWRILREHYTFESSQK